MITLTVTSTQPQFTQFLLERFDIEGNLCLSLVRCLTPVTLAASGDF